MRDRVSGVLVAFCLAVLGAVFALAVLTSCTPEPVVIPPKERPEPGTPADCTTACARLEHLGCEEAKPTPAGATCEDVCNNVQQSGATALDLACVIDAGSCEVANACGYGGPP